MTLHDKAVEAAREDTGLWWIKTYEVSDLVRAYLAAMAAAGWKLTPREATMDMRVAMGSAWRDNQNNCPSHFAWTAGHDAAPNPEDTP